MARLYEVAGDMAEFCQSLFPLLVAHSDDFGRLQGDGFTIKHACLPFSPRTVDDFDVALGYLSSVKLIQRYEHGDEVFVQIEKFDEHQTGLHKRTASKYPPPDQAHVVPFAVAGKQGPDGNSRKFPEIPPEENRREQKGREEKAPSGAAPVWRPGSRSRTAGLIDGREQRRHQTHRWCAHPRSSLCVTSHIHAMCVDRLGGDAGQASARLLSEIYPKAIADLGSAPAPDALDFWRGVIDGLVGKGKAAAASGSSLHGDMMSDEEFERRYGSAG